MKRRLRADSAHSTAAELTFLNRWTGHCSIGTVDATIAGLRFQQLPAAFAVIEPLTRIRWHCFRFDMSTLRASDDGA